MSKRKDTENGIVTKEEAMNLLSAQLRKPTIESEVLVKVMSLYSKIAGWDKEQEPEPAEPSLDELVTAVEKKRKQHAQ